MNEPAPNEAPAIANLELKAAMLLVLMLLLVGGSVAYLMYARGAFESTQELILLADDSEGIKVGMDLTFSGFPIGRVRRIELDEDGNARIRLDVPRKDAHWLRESSVFTLVRGILGNTNIRAYSGILSDPPLPDGAQRKLLVGDATAEIPRLVSATRDLVQNLNAMTAADSSLNASLSNVRSATDRLSGRHGALSAIFGNDRDARKVVEALERTNALLARFDQLAAHADNQVFGEDGVVPQARTSVMQLNALLGEARESLKRVDAVLGEAQGIAANARVATADLAPLRAEVEASLRKVEHLVDEVNRKWPFSRDTELKLP
jgi:phospholipid/cholesterol/gamma-HCH transport system substrate-binding protein